MTISMDYFRNINNCKNTTSKQETDLYEIKRNIIIGFEDTVDFHVITVNGISQGLIIVHKSGEPYQKSIKSRPDETFKLGDLIVWDGNNWLVTDVDSDNQIYTKGTIEQCNYNLKFQSTEGTLLTYPVVFESGDGSLQTDSMLTTVNSKSQIKCRFDEKLSNLLVSGKRLMIDSRIRADKPNCYKIAMTNLQSYDSGTNGILNIYLEKDEYNSTTDNKLLGICDYGTVVISTGSAKISYSGNCEVKCGGSYKSFVGSFVNGSGVVLDLIPVWSMVSSTGSIGNFTTAIDPATKTIKIKCADISSMIGSTLTLSLAESTNAYSSTLIIKVVSL